MSEKDWNCVDCSTRHFVCGYNLVCAYHIVDL